MFLANAERQRDIKHVQFPIRTQIARLLLTPAPIIIGNEIRFSQILSVPVFL